MSFAPAYADGDSVPVTEEMPIDTATYAGNQGALLVQDGAYIEECAADPTQILGVAVSAGGVDSTGYSRTGRKEFPPGQMQFYRVTRGQQFRARYVGSVPANLGGSYGVVRDTDGLWKVDFAETTTVSVRYVRNLLASELPATAALGGRPEVIVEFLPAAIVP